jgi:hypothetical protein
MKVLGPLLFASLAAVGNAMFAAGQKKAAGLQNTLAFMGLTVAFCFILMTAAAPLFGPTGYPQRSMRQPWHT